MTPSWEKKTTSASLSLKIVSICEATLVNKWGFIKVQTWGPFPGHHFLSKMRLAWWEGGELNMSYVRPAPEAAMNNVSIHNRICWCLCTSWLRCAKKSFTATPCAMPRYAVGISVWPSSWGLSGDVTRQNTQTAPDWLKQAPLPRLDRHIRFSRASQL